MSAYRQPNDPYHDDMSHTVVAELVAAVMKVEVDVG
ncbi:MAG: hypothetical protein K0S98_628, partial [Propionibacteriaceae bacterium]|nr:hypothetical protein [Propionibacteriaceae bacterium]